ncbi:MAG: hypothetical protein WD048_01270 [Chitinophagales bacterium]
MKKHSVQRATQIRIALFLLPILLIFAQCSRKIQDKSIIHQGGELRISKKENKPPLNIHFFGVTNFFIELEGKALLTDPFISNPVSKKVVFGKIATDTSIVDSFIAAVDLKKTRMVSIGHAHYDHLMDWPYMSNFVEPDKVVFAGSETAVNTVAAYNQKLAKVQKVNDLMGNIEQPGQWIYSIDSSMRLMAFEAEHPSHFMGITLYSGHYHEALEEAPVKAKRWKMGQPLSYLVDFLDEGKIQYRIFIQTSNGEKPAGYFPKEMLINHPVDIAFLSIALKGKKIRELEEMVNYIEPQLVFLGHWENFMQEKTAPVRAVAKSNISKHWIYIKEKFPEHPEFVLPMPGSAYVVNGLTKD